jgi:tetratricopeptide (TPR) repeat protein
MKPRYLISLLAVIFLFNCAKKVIKEPPTPPVDITKEEIKAENWVSEAIVLYQNKNYQEAIINWRKALAIFPEDAELFNFIGLAYHRIGKLDSAITYYSKAVELDSNYHQAWNNLGYMYFLKSEYKTALKYFETSLKTNPNYAQAQLNYQKTQQILNGQISLQAFELFEKTTQNDSLELQIKNYRNILEIDSNYVDAWNNLGVSYFYYSNFDSAIYCIKKALDKNPDYPQAHNNAGYILDGLNKYDEAIAHYQKAIQIRPNYEIAYANLIDTYVRKEDYHSAKIILDALLKFNPDSSLAQQRFNEYKLLLYE